MDIVLEIFDTFIADYAYAYLFPIGYANQSDFDASTQATATWVWRPATKFFHAQPSQAAYMSSMMRDNPYRQLFTLFFMTWFVGTVVYLISATLFYYLIFDKRYMNHPKFMKNQIWMEIRIATQSLPCTAILMTPLFLLGVRGYANLYDTTADGPGWWYDILQIPLFLLFSDFCNYWIHRLSHRPRIYKHNLYMHKLHHRFVISTPYASYAIHPIEGFALSLPFIIFPFIFPLQKIVHIGLYMLANSWVIGIHDCEFFTNNRIVNGAGCHSLHHTYRDCNYGQFFTLFDRLHGTYREPENLTFQNERWMSDMQRKKESQRVKVFSKENNNNDERTSEKYKANSKNKKYE